MLLRSVGVRRSLTGGESRSVRRRYFAVRSASIVGLVQSLSIGQRKSESSILAALSISITIRFFHSMVHISSEYFCAHIGTITALNTVLATVSSTRFILIPLVIRDWAMVKLDLQTEQRRPARLAGTRKASASTRAMSVCLIVAVMYDISGLIIIISGELLLSTTLP